MKQWLSSGSFAAHVCTGLVDLQCNRTTSFCLPVEDAVCKFTYKPIGVVCRSKDDVCDVEETCTGADAECPSDVFVPAGTVCDATAAPAVTCSGQSSLCPVIAADSLPELDLGVGVSGACNDSVFDAVVASVLDQLLSMDTSTASSEDNSTIIEDGSGLLDVQKTDCTESTDVSNLQCTCLHTLMTHHKIYHTQYNWI